MESGGVKGTGDIPKGYYQDVNGKWHRPDGVMQVIKKWVYLNQVAALNVWNIWVVHSSKASRTGKEVIERMKMKIHQKYEQYVVKLNF